MSKPPSIIFQPGRHPTTTSATMQYERNFYNAIKNSMRRLYHPDDLDLICTELVTLMKSTEPELFSEGMALLATYNKQLLTHIFVAKCYQAYFACDY